MKCLRTKQSVLPTSETEGGRTTMPPEQDVTSMRVHQLDAGYGRTCIVQGVDVEVRAGEMVAVLGLNGAGKSTLLKAVAGIAKVMGGRIDVGDVDMSRLPAHRRIELGVAYVGQGQDLFPKMSVLENIVMGGYILDRAVRRQRLQEALDFFPALSDKRAQRAGTLSGGQRQQLKLARALMTAPRFLLLDEPSAGLSPGLVDSVFANITEIVEHSGAGVLLVEQNVRQALAVTDRAMILSAGQTVFMGTTAELRQHDDLKHRYLGV